MENQKNLKVLKDTQEIHDLKIKLYSSQNECEKARSHLLEQQKENEKNKKMIKLEEEQKQTLKLKNSDELSAKRKLHNEIRMLSELNKSKDVFFVEKQRTINCEMRELEIQGQTEITE